MQANAIEKKRVAVVGRKEAGTRRVNSEFGNYPNGEGGLSREWRKRWKQAAEVLRS